MISMGLTLQAVIACKGNLTSEKLLNKHFTNVNANLFDCFGVPEMRRVRLATSRIVFIKKSDT